jgi:hypothetical protein
MADFLVRPANGYDLLRMKIGRAYTHFQDFDKRVVAHCTRADPYTVTEHHDTVRGRYILRCKFANVDGGIALCLGDFAYALRSGLDQLTWNLVLLKDSNPNRFDIMFPIHSHDSDKSERKFLKRVGGMPLEAVQIIRDLQPYKRGDSYRDDPLWKLNELCNMDKHRSPAGRYHGGNFTMHPSGGIVRHFDDGFEVSWPIAFKQSVVFEPRTPTLIFGDPINTPIAPDSPEPVEFTREEIAEIYRYIREDVAPRFACFFEGRPNAN